MKPYKTLFLLCLLFVQYSCTKYLDEKSDKALVVPSTIEDCQALLDNNASVNQANSGIGEVSADNYYLTTSIYQALSGQADRSMYVWDEEIFYDVGLGGNDWNLLYSVANRANVVLETMQKITRTPQNAAAWDNAVGSALFIRSEVFSVLARNFAKAYDNASNDLGIPLRLGSDFNVPSVRSSVQETYNQIVTDLSESIRLLPPTPTHIVRPSKTAAYALLSRVYLAMRNYDKAALYADSSLKINSTLIDYNSLSATASFPFARFNTETVYFAQGLRLPLTDSRAKIDSLLYASYSANDLRRSLFFAANGDGTYRFKGNYTASSNLFVGIATDEVYLTKAEAVCRAGSYTEALAVLNTLLSKRWKTGTFVPFTATNQNAALALILTERRKELLMRDLRWMDIKRLNKESAGIHLKRILNNQEYSLPANDNRFALPLPANIIAISGMPQNPR